jgi:hypothetical protein
MDGIGDHDVSQTQKDKYHVFSHLRNLDLKKKDLRVEGRLFGKRKTSRGRGGKKG